MRSIDGFAARPNQLDIRPKSAVVVCKLIDAKGYYVTRICIESSTGRYRREECCQCYSRQSSNRAEQGSRIHSAHL